MANSIFNEGDLQRQIPEVVDNLTTNDGTKALSAKQGKVLNDQITTQTISNPYTIPSDFESHTDGNFTVVAYKAGNVVQINAYNIKYLIAGSIPMFCKLIEGIRPKSILYYMCYDETSEKAALGALQANGNIGIYSTGVNHVYDLSICFLV